MTIATDRVDSEMIDYPRRWNIQAIRKFMITFGLVSSVFDYLTFGVLLLILHANQDQFRTGWFLESVISASLRPSQYLLIATLLVVVATLVLPLTPLGMLLGLPPMPISFLLLIGIIVVGYMLSAEMTKRVCYSKVKV